MIDIRNETVLSLSDAAKSLPSIDGKRPHISTLWRWHRHGVGRGKIRLECTWVGGRLVTSREALQRFTERLAESDAQHREEQELPDAVSVRTRTSSARELEIERAENQSSQAGV